MKLRTPLLALLSGGCLLMAVFSLAEDAPTPKNFGAKGGDLPEDPREYQGGRYAELPNWPVSKDLPNDVFTFARLKYESSRSRWRGGKWLTDYPDSDLNFSYRLQQLTSLQVNPKGAIVEINAEQMRHYPFIYMIEPGDINITDDEALTIREYLLNGGFIMVDDFWGDHEWDTFYNALKQIFPDREPKELPLEHEIFHMIFDLKIKPQIPSVGVAVNARHYGEYLTYEPGKPGVETVHYKGVFDDKGRMVMIICHNTDLGDGWEEEGTDPWYFREFSEKYAYPLGINILFYALSH